jgi:hypothetical protein
VTFISRSVVFSVLCVRKSHDRYVTLVISTDVCVGTRAAAAAAADEAQAVSGSGGALNGVGSGASSSVGSMSALANVQLCSLHSAHVNLTIHMNLDTLQSVTTSTSTSAATVAHTWVMTRVSASKAVFWGR